MIKAGLGRLCMLDEGQASALHTSPRLRKALGDPQARRVPAYIHSNVPGGRGLLLCLRAGARRKPARAKAVFDICRPNELGPTGAPWPRPR